MEKSYSFIFLGLTHGFINDFDKQKKLIKAIKPEFVLSEEMENISLENEFEYKKFLEKKKHSKMTSFDDVENLVNLCRDEKIKLIGIDLENFGFSKEIIEKINREEFDEKLELEIEKIVKKRELYQINKIKEYKNKSKKTILVFLGSWHLREDSPLLKEFSNSKIIFPANSKGEIVLEPTEENISYGEKLI